MAATLPPASGSGSVSSTVAASIYVGDLHPSVTEGLLFDAFAEFKSLTSVRLCKDASTGRSLCYGYANFLSRHDANLAIEEKNHSMLNGKMIRVMWSVREPDARKNGAGNVFVKNLPDSLNNVDLQDMFKKFGNIFSSKVATFEDGKSRGYGFVQFEQEDAALAAIENLNGTTVAHKEIYVGKFMKKTDRVIPAVKHTNLYIKNLDADVSEDLLRQKFLEFGKIVSLAIAKDENGACRGFAFVNFENQEDARRAAETLNGTQFGSKSLYVGTAQKKAEREKLLKERFEGKSTQQKMKAKVANIYVKNINVEVTEEELREHFSQCGTITSAKLMCDEKGISKGFGFVCFSTPEEATDAVKTFNGHMFHGKPLYVATAQRKEERKQLLEVQFRKLLDAGGSSSSASVFPGIYPPLYYTNPQSGMLYNSPNLVPAWNSTNLINSRNASFQAVTYPSMVANMLGHVKQNSGGRLNGNAVSYVPQVYNNQSSQKLPLSRDFSNQQIQHHKSYGRGKEMKKSIRRGQLETLGTMPFAAPRGKQKQMLGEQLYPLVEKLEPQCAAKITGMLLEMNNAELLPLLESPEHLGVKVREAVEVLKSAKENLAGRSNDMKSGVSVN